MCKCVCALKNPVSGKLLNFKRQMKKARQLAAERYIFNIETDEGTSGMTLFRAKSRASMASTSYTVSVCLVKETGGTERGVFMQSGTIRCRFT